MQLDTPDVPTLLASGAGLGAAGGAGSGLLANLQNLKNVAYLKGHLPEMEAQRTVLKQILDPIRKNTPALKGWSDRRMVNFLLGQQGLDPELYYHLRRGREEGLLGRSRAAKTLKALQRRMGRSVLKRSLIGTGLGLGGGLLGATALGYFDK